MLFAEGEATGFITIAERLGVPVALLALMIFFGYKAFKWAAAKVFEPWVKSNLDLIAAIKENNTKNTEANEKNSAALVKLADAEEKKAESYTKVATATEQTLQETKETNKRLDCLCVQTAEQNKVVYAMAKAICDKEGVICPPEPETHKPCGDPK